MTTDIFKSLFLSKSGSQETGNAFRIDLMRVAAGGLKRISHDLRARRPPLSQCPLQVLRIQPQRHFNVLGRDSAQPSRNSLQREQEAARHQVGDDLAAWQTKPLEIKESGRLNPRLFPCVPAFERARRAVMHDNRIRLEDQRPPGSDNSQAPLVILTVHMKTVVKPADLVYDLMLYQHRGSAQHIHNST